MNVLHFRYVVLKWERSVLGFDGVPALEEPFDTGH